ncbi:AP-5 complex subunit sigma-1 isoform X3 [Alligator sinensis]|nr:AP-5 complex subunit sigma-1 isoform X3 [Alligator sinensis]
MVHAFLLHTLSPRPGDAAGPGRLLYSRVFGSERPDAAPEPPGLQELERERLGQKERMLVVARQVDTMCKLQQQVSGRPAADVILQLPDEPVSLQDAPAGLFRLPAGDPFGDRKTVLWLGVLSLGFVLVCDPHENLMLAESTLRLLARYLLDHLRLLGPGNDIVLKADKTEVILNKVLPHGQLLFLNDQFVQALERELSATLPK